MNKHISKFIILGFVFALVSLLGGCVPPPTEPLAFDDSFRMVQNTVKEFNVITNDNLHYNEDEISITLLTFPRHGNLYSDTKGGIRYTPDPDFVGEDSFTYQLVNPLGRSDATVFIIVKATNIAPVAHTHHGYETIENDSIRIDLTQLDYDSDDGQEFLIFDLKERPQYGRCSIYNGNLVYEPNEEAIEEDTFTYVLSDGIDEVEGQIFIHFLDRPVLNKDYGKGKINQTITINPLANDLAPGTTTNVSFALGTNAITWRPIEGSYQTMTEGQATYTVEGNTIHFKATKEGTYYLLYSVTNDLGYDSRSSERIEIDVTDTTQVILRLFKLVGQIIYEFILIIFNLRLLKLFPNLLPTIGFLFMLGIVVFIIVYKLQKKAG